jgi:hypothetical protein
MPLGALFEGLLVAQFVFFLGLLVLSVGLLVLCLTLA